MTENLKIEVSMVDVEGGVVDTSLATKEELTTAVQSKADLIEGKIPVAQLPNFDQINGVSEAINGVETKLRNEVATALGNSNNSLESRIDTKLETKADLVNGRVPASQSPAFKDVEGAKGALDGLKEALTTKYDQKVLELSEGKADLVDGKIQASQLPTGEIVTPLDFQLKSQELDTKFSNLEDSVEAEKNAFIGQVGNLISGKANVVDVYSKAAVDNKLSGKVDIVKYNEDMAKKADRTYVDAGLTAVTAGHKAYTTLALAQAAQASLTANTIVEVTNDPTTSNNGTYQWNGTALTKSAYDPLTQAKDYTDDKDLILQNQINLIPKTAENEKSKSDLDDFYGHYQNGLLIDATQESDIQVLSVTNGVKSYDSIDNFFAGAFLSPKLVVGKSGALEFSRHNIFLKTDDLTSNGWAKTGLTATKNQRSVKGDLSATLLTSNATTANVKQNVHNIAFNRDVCVSVIIKPVSGVTHAYLMLASGINVIFDLASKTVSSLSSASSASIQDIGLGYFKISAVFNVATAVVGVGISDNSSIVATKTGLAAIIEQLQLNLGGVAQEYLKNTGATIKCLAAFDYSKGKRTLLVETQRTYRGTYSEDFTQAAWVKTGLAAALTATSPLNTLCSRLTATANDATALQTIAQTVLRFSIFIKRVVGSGPVSVTVDNGTTWQDITGQLSTSKYTRIVVDGSGKTYGLKIATLGDVLDVCLANPHDRVNTLSPAQFYAAGSIFAVDNIPEIAISGEVTAYYKAYPAEFNGVQNFFQPLRLTSSDGSGMSAVSSSLDNPNVGSTLHSASAATTHTKHHNRVADLKVFESTVLASYSAKRYEVDVNTDYAYPFVDVGEPIFTGVKIGTAGSGSYHVEKILIVKEAVDVYDISTWRRSQDNNAPKLKNVCVITKDSQFAGTTLMREPIVHVLSDDNEIADLLIVHMNKLRDGYHNEAPARLLQRKVRYTKSTNKFTYLTPTEVFYEHPLWSSGQGHMQSVAIARIKSGVNAGRLVAVFTMQLEGTGLDNRNLYCSFNDSDGDANAWTAPVKIIDSLATYGVGSTTASPDGALISLPSNHPIAPNRLIIPIYNVGWFAAVYSDDFGVTWQSTAIVSSPTTDEPTMCYLPNGDLLVSLRTSNAYSRINYKSSDGGITWVNVGSMINFVGERVSGSLVQLDPTGIDKIDKPYGSPYLVISGGTDSIGRGGLSINKIEQDLLTISDRSYAINTVSYVGYSSTKPIFNNEYLAVAFEGGRNKSAFNTNNSSYLAIVKV